MATDERLKRLSAGPAETEVMAGVDDIDRLLAHLDLREYEATALEHLLSLGRTTAPNLVEATGIPQARIYDVLEALADRGFVKIIPGRPKEYQPKPPATILDRAVENRRQSYASYRAEIADIREDFLATFEPIFEAASQDITPTEELFWVVDVGDPSETETRQLYHDATEEVCVLTKSFEYFQAVEPAVADALDRGVSVRVLMLDPPLLSDENRDIQESVLAHLRTTHADIDLRFSPDPLPWRGTLADPSMEYDRGRAILLVEEKDIPLHMRQAAVTENGSFVAGMKRYFDLIWDYESSAEPTT